MDGDYRIMLFNSLEFAVFMAIVYGLYLVLNHKWQNRMLLVASYIFYGAWNWKFLSLIFISTILDYICGIRIYNSVSMKRKRIFLFLSVFGNLSILGFFKYFNFFAGDLTALINHFGFSIRLNSLNIILPVGISFYTFQTMSYTIDIYRGGLRPTRKFFDFALFVAFFPQLVAGPIERAKNLLPQILSPRTFNVDRFYEGCYLIFWGLFQKVVIADNLAKIAEPVFNGWKYKSGEIVLAMYAFAFQIFCDFAGYSNIARGLGKLLGFEIMENFRQPYLSTNPREFWRRWHISLSSWLRDYLYIPLGGSRKGAVITRRNILITMLLGGLWHGAAWTFVFWGIYHAFLLMAYRRFEILLEKISPPRNIIVQRLWWMAKVIFFFHLVCFGWLIFRASSLNQAVSLVIYLFSGLQFPPIGELGRLLFLIAPLFAVGILQYKRCDLLAMMKLRPAVQIVSYLVMLYYLLLLGVRTSEEFVYFQF